MNAAQFQFKVCFLGHIQINNATVAQVNNSIASTSKRQTKSKRHKGRLPEQDKEAKMGQPPLIGVLTSLHKLEFQAAGCGLADLSLASSLWSL